MLLASKQRIKPPKSLAALQVRRKLRILGGSRAGGVGPMSSVGRALPPPTLPASLLAVSWERGQLTARVPNGLQNLQLEVR